MTTNPQNIPRAIAALVAALALPLTASAAIDGSSHDFAAASWNTKGEICQPCHTTHNDNGEVGAPLWNHDATSATFTLYASGGSIQADDLGQPTGTSKLCLSCHDGTVALDSYGGSTTTTANSKTLTSADAGYVGIDLSNDHPVSFTYDQALVDADGGLNAIADVSSLLIGGKVECASCHDPHNDGGFSKMLVMSNAGSALCLTCHNK